MNKQFLFLMLIGVAIKMPGSEQGAAPLELLKLHIFDKVSNDFFSLKCFKHYMSTQGGSIHSYQYINPEYEMWESESITINIRLNSWGIIDVRYAELPYSSPLISLIYHWSSTSEKLSLHIVEGYYGDKKSLKLNPAVLAPSNNVALVLKGGDLKESYFYYFGMPEED